MADIIATLFAANAVILLVMAAAFWFAGRRRGDQPYWHSWSFANLLIGTALVVFIVEPHLSGRVADILPNGLLVAGFCLRWRAAREFGLRPARPAIVWGPVGIFSVLCLAPYFIANYQATYTVVNVLLAVFAFATAWEFWRDRADALPSRYGLVAAYAIMGASFAARVAQGLFADGFGTHMPQDMMLVIHLCVALLHTPASGAFALSLAYERSTARWRHEATHDALTGLFNRRAFETALRNHIASGDAFSVLLFDIDHFKAINDRYGHAAGDAAIRSCAEILRGELGDQAETARIGGEEFAAILPAGEALQAAERVRRAVRASIFGAGERQLTMTISAGICESTQGRDFDEIMRIADNGLYAAKNRGRNRVEGEVAA